ncbi:hypothetical protein EST38_g13015 [Candolleomyces aberdarensis]|uniref:JmjC domain-containing protein n=1 Tax=Candolleomyces aberdarensis TaxID=2316362 RepID=A0A4Q2D0Y3_9AGAR|nr:hypothetical protein EST38_g13015 [Candolleomyces aberdarensis]
MLEGNVAVPDEIPDEMAAEASESLNQLFAAVDRPRLCQIVLQAIAISPLILLLTMDLAKGLTICPEETLATFLTVAQEQFAPQRIKQSLKIDNALSVYSDQHSRKFTFFDGEKRPHGYTPFIHVSDVLFLVPFPGPTPSLIQDRGDYVAWTAIFEAIAPQFVENPDSSLLCCMSSSVARQTSIQDFQNLLKHCSIVITNYTEERLQFDLQGLSQLADVDHQMDIQDQTVPVLDGEFQRRVFTGTLRALHQTSTAPRNKRKSLNALYLPNPHALLEESPYATDGYAVRRIAVQDKHCIRKLPTEDIRWSLAATKGAHHYFHIDSRGDGTFNDVVKGQKLWVLAQPKLKKRQTSTKLWTKENLDVTSLDLSQWDVEAVLLTEGSRLLMRPGTVHAVFTPANAICRGGHFLATSTMPETLYGMIHCFFKGKMLTNIDHPTIQSRINAIVCYFYKALFLGTPDLVTGYLPDISTQDGLQQLIATVCLVELHNMICLESYQPTNEELVAWRLQEDGISIDDALSLYDVSSVAYSSRMENIYSRGRAISVLKATLGRVTTQGEDGKTVDGWNDLFVPMLAWLLVALQGYYNMAFDQAEDTSIENPNIRSQATHRIYGEALAFYSVTHLSNEGDPQDINLAVYIPLTKVKTPLMCTVQGRWSKDNQIKVVECQYIHDVVGIWKAANSDNVYILCKHPGLEHLNEEERGQTIIEGECHEGG